VTEVDPSEFHVARISIGALGRDDKGTPVDAVLVEFSLPTGERFHVDWDMDAGDRENMQKLSDYYEARLKSAVAGQQGFTPTTALPDFKVDR
jgi:hypothetical protein